MPSGGPISPAGSPAGYPASLGIHACPPWLASLPPHHLAVLGGQLGPLGYKLIHHCAHTWQCVTATVEQPICWQGLWLNSTVRHATKHAALKLLICAVYCSQFGSSSPKASSCFSLAQSTRVWWSPLLIKASQVTCQTSYCTFESPSTHSQSIDSVVCSIMELCKLVYLVEVFHCATLSWLYACVNIMRSVEWNLKVPWT